MASVPRDKRLPLTDTNIRGRLVSPSPASAYAGALRSFHARNLNGLLGGPQLGVIPGGGTENALFTTSLMLALAQSRKVSAGVLFANAKGAFTLPQLSYLSGRVSKLTLVFKLSHRYHAGKSNFMHVKRPWRRISRY